MPGPQTITIEGITHAMIEHTSLYTACRQWCDGTIEMDAEPVMTTCLFCILVMYELPKFGWRLREHP